jgi:hypothetical protein
MVHISFRLMMMMKYTPSYYKENTEALVVTCKEIRLEVNADKTKYMVMSGDQNAG